jgi:predicted porin
MASSKFYCIKEFKMAKDSFFKAAVFLMLFAGLAAGASAQVTISGGFALSVMEAKDGGNNVGNGKVGAGANIYADYLLPISVPLSLGLEIGVDTASISEGSAKVTGTVVPILLRAAYHFDLLPKLDLYGVGKIGVALGSAESNGASENGYNGVGFGIDLGAAYYFVPRFGIFVEVGFDRYNLEKNISGTKIEVPFSRIVTIGVSTKF